jgi:hypothetical protein
MVGFLDKSLGRLPRALDQAFRCFGFCRKRVIRLQSDACRIFTRSCSHVWPTCVFNADQSYNWSCQNDSDTRIPRPDPTSSSSENTSSHPPHYMAETSNSWRRGHDATRSLEPLAHSNTFNTVFGMQRECDFDLLREAEGVFSSFHNPILPLTGIDYNYWLEIRKIFDGQDGMWFREIHSSIIRDNASVKSSWVKC